MKPFPNPPEMFPKIPTTRTADVPSLLPNPCATPGATRQNPRNCRGIHTKSTRKPRTNPLRSTPLTAETHSIALKTRTQPTRDTHDPRRFSTDSPQIPHAEPFETRPGSPPDPAAHPTELSQKHAIPLRFPRGNPLLALRFPHEILLDSDVLPCSGRVDSRCRTCRIGRSYPAKTR